MDEKVPHGDQSHQEEQQAIPLSPEFLSGGTEAGLEKLRARLLDLTNRNRLLNFRHTTASTLRVVDADLDSVFTFLLNGEQLRIRPVPEPPIDTWVTVDEESAPLKPPAADHAAKLGWSTSYDLPERLPDTVSSDRLPVLHYVDDLEALTRKIGSAARTAIEESGTNMLHLTLGFLEWYESDDSQQTHMAPLLTVPVELERSSAKDGVFECAIAMSQEDLGTNLSLVEKMRRDFGIEIPSVEEEDTPTTYFGRFAPILSQRPRWTIRRHITLSLLSFGKLLMYRDLDAKVWPAITKHALVRELFEGRKRRTITHADEYLIDDPELKHPVPPLIVDADSSQHSALIDVLRGENLVIEGPPGTGKSQTITNLIANALGTGKTVLFISEKLAALEVVRRRLDETGLGIFCLELHSHKTRKDALLKDLELRLKSRGTFRDPRELDRYVSSADAKGRLLTKHVRLMNKELEPLGSTVFEILWARERALQELPFPHDLVERVLLPVAVGFARADVARTEQFLTVYAQHLEGVLRVCSGIVSHPWAWVGRVLSFEEQERVCDLLTTLTEKVSDAEECARQVKKQVGISLEPSLNGLASARHLLAALPAPTEPLNGHLLAPCRDEGVRERLLVFIRDVETAISAREALAAATTDGDPGALQRVDIVETLRHAVDSMTALGLQSATGAQVSERLDRGRTDERALLDAETSFSLLTGVLGCPLPPDAQGIELLLNSVLAITKAPIDLLHLRGKYLEPESIGRLLTSGSDQAHALRSRHEILDQTADMEGGWASASGRAELSARARAAEEAGWWQQWFGRDYRAARRLYRRVARQRHRPSREMVARTLRAMDQYFEARARFEGNPEYVAPLGVAFKGVDTDWDGLQRVAAWYRQVLVLMPTVDERAAALRDLLFNSTVERFTAITASLARHQTHRNTVEQLRVALPGIVEVVQPVNSSVQSLQALRDELRKQNEYLDEATEAIRAAGLRSDLEIVSIRQLTDAAERHRANLGGIDGNKEVRGLLGGAFNGAATTLDPIRGAVSVAAAVSNALPSQVVDWLLCPDHVSRWDQLRRLLNGVTASADELTDVRTKILALTAPTGGSPDGAELLAALGQQATLALTYREELSQWLHFIRLRTDSEAAGLGKLTRLGDAGSIDPGALVHAFHFVFHNTLARSALAEHPDLFSFSGLTQDAVRAQFAAADKEVIRLQRERVCHVVDRRVAPQGNQNGPVKTWTDLGLVTHEISKQKRHLPIRQLVRRAGTALQAMKPCFMMGPLSVAQYLAPGHLQFDLIVMDEASQLKPEDAIGAIARGGQMVIVGDPKQLPPTSFFERVALDDDADADDERTAIEESESILDVASTLYQPVRRLRWHYRSRHHSLIAFSNHEFYDGDLIVFPSAYHDSADLGVKYHAVRAGIFEQRRNAAEAAAIVEAVLLHMQERPHESLGVVTLNFDQRELVEELLDHRLHTDPYAIEYQERMSNGPEPLFVKNLENVQGDERDVIFISATYGPDSRGNQYQRFGPINGPNGHRRLNVLFTRAKKRTEVFCSLDPDKIQVTSSSAWGLRVFKQYLSFARTGVLEAPGEGNRPPPNDFQRSVGSVLRENGFDVESEVKFAGFFIDLGVRHPTKPGTFLVGVECDGATYHSARSARDRDRLRQQILENQGWKIHRIWSTDWFKSRNTEIKRVLARIDELLAADPDHRREMARLQRITSLRQQLVDLRDGEMLRAFPDSSGETCLLRDAVLEELVRKHPTTRDAWFKAIPYDLRASTDSKQVARYLDQVLAIVASAVG